MTYIQANFCNSMVDMDLFFLQICSIQLPSRMLLESAIESFGVAEWLSMCLLSQPQEMEQDSMLEGLLTFLATIVTSRTNLGNDEKTQCIIEISALLATGDKTHSQLLELMPERSGNAHTRNFEKFLKELSVFRRPPIGSENLDQGLFIPISDVWEKYYDPLHVLLRAVHRRDFQNSMDRFTNYVKQEKKMPKSGNLWPPFRVPGPVGPAYSDPSCILHSKILHAAILRILYRAVNSHNVSEHMLALAVYLLELAVTSSDKVTTEFALECGRNIPNTASYSNKVQDLLNDYPGDCLNENLRLNIARVALSSPEPQVSPANYSNTTFDTDLDWDVNGADDMTTLTPNPNDARLALPQDLSIVREQSLVLHHQHSMDEEMTVLRTLPPLTLSDTVQAITEYTPRRITGELIHIGPHLALPPTQLPRETGMEVAIRRDLGLATTGTTSRPHSEMFSPTSNVNTGIMLPFQRVQPVAVPSRSLDIVASNSNNQRRMHPLYGGKAKQVEAGCMSDTKSIAINESILSLLLKLHSQLSGSLDSFSLDENNETAMDYDQNEAGPSTRPDTSQNTSESRIGDGPFFIGNLLRKIAKADSLCAHAIEEIRQRLWPNQREKQAEQKAKENKEKEERSKRARDRQQKLMQEFAHKQKKFMEQATEDMECDDEEEEIEQQREKEYVCIICNMTSPSTEANPVGMVVLVESSGVIGHRRRCGECFMLPLNDEEQQRPSRKVRLSTEFERRTELLTYNFGEESWFLSNNTSPDSGVHVQSCGHYVHLSCHEAYLSSLYTSQRHQNLNVERGEFLCPVCRQMSNSVLPLSPQFERPTPVVRIPGRSFETLVTELTNLIKKNVRPAVSDYTYPIFFTNFNNCSSIDRIQCYYLLICQKRWVVPWKT